MRIIDFIKRVLSSIFSVSGARVRDVGLYRDEEESFAYDVGEVIKNRCRVTAEYVDDGTPAKDVAVHFRVLRGPLRITPSGAQEVTVKTDAVGTAWVDLEFTEKGYGLLVAQLPDSPRKKVFFNGHTQDTTHRLSVYSEDTFLANPGVVTARIVANDHHGIPVEGASLDFSGIFGEEKIIEGKVKEIGKGVYEGTFQTHIAGCWKLIATDTLTNVSGRRCVCILPDSPKSFDFIGGTDPRGGQPYGELNLRARLLDQYSNALDPNRIKCSIGGKDLSAHTYAAGEARFLIKAAGYTDVNVLLKDGSSEIYEKLTIPFAAAWMERPGVIYTDTVFKTGVFLIPEEDRAVRSAVIEVQFNPELASFASFEEASVEGMELHTTTRVEADKLIIDVKSERDITASEFPNGVFIGTTGWQCLGEGDTCFNVVALMSPASAVWSMCPSQKKKHTQCLCVNIIYEAGNNSARSAGSTVSNQINNVLGSDENLEECCPPVNVQVSFTAISVADWTNDVEGVVGGTQITNREQAKQFTNSEHPSRTGITNGVKDNCLNFFMFPIDTSAAGFVATTRSYDDSNNRMVSVVNPGSIGTQNTGAHEAVHGLGVRNGHATAGGDTDNIMHVPRTERTGAELNEDQCETIFNNVDKYKC